MNVLILTNPDQEDFIYDATKDAITSHLVFGINNKGDFEKFIRSFSYDIGISFMYLHKVPAEQVNTHTWINFHPAPLPAYKGRNLCYHAIMNGETEFGATVHYMDESFDTGDIIEVLKFSIPEWATAEDLSEFAISASRQLFQLYLPRILAGEDFDRLPNSGGQYYPKTEIGDTLVCLDGDYSFNLNRFVRSVTYKNFHPKLYVGGVKYKIVRDE